MPFNETLHQTKLILKRRSVKIDSRAIKEERGMFNYDKTFDSIVNFVSEHEIARQ
jgi:hypothetical protein